MSARAQAKCASMCFRIFEHTHMCARTYAFASGELACMRIRTGVCVSICGCVHVQTFSQSQSPLHEVFRVSAYVYVCTKAVQRTAVTRKYVCLRIHPCVGCAYTHMNMHTCARAHVFFQAHPCVSEQTDGSVSFCKHFRAPRLFRQKLHACILRRHWGAMLA